MDRELEWGETPWDPMSRDDLLREVQRMYAALVRLESIAKLCQIRDEGSPFWGPRGTGGGGLEMARQILEPLHEQHTSENIYRAFFRYAVDLLFQKSGFDIRTGWAVCDKCGQMIGASAGDEIRDERTLVGTKCSERLPGKCDGVLRALEWKDLEPQPERTTVKI